MTYENFGNIIRNMWQNILDTIKEQRWITSGNLGNIIRNMLQIIQGDTIVQNRCGHGKLWERHREHWESIWDLQLSDTLRTVWDQDMGTYAMQTPCGIKCHTNGFLVQLLSWYVNICHLKAQLVLSSIYHFLFPSSIILPQSQCS